MTLPAIDKHQLLSTHFLFRDLAPEEIERIAKIGGNKKLAANETLFLKGDPGSALYGVLSGRVRISSSSPDGKEVIISILEPGGVFGEIALLDGMPRTADASALEPVELFMIHRREFLEFLKGHPTLTTHLLKMVCSYVRSSNEFVEDFIFLGLSKRLAKRLLSLRLFYGEHLTETEPKELKISQVELGQIMGTSREAINRQLQEWRKEGWIKLGKGRINILDPEALRELVEEED